MPEASFVRPGRAARPLAVLAALIFVQCDSHPTVLEPPVADNGTLTVQITPSDSEIQWRANPPEEWPIRFTPAMTWDVSFISPVSTWKLDIRVRLLDEGGGSCFESEGTLDDVFQGLPYVASGSTFSFPRGSDWTQGACGNDFTVSQVDAVVSIAYVPGSTRRIQDVLTRSIPVELRFVRTGEFGPPPEQDRPQESHSLTTTSR
jgi:hypothetical protein